MDFTLKFYFMATNLIESIQKNLGYPDLNKVDPNTQAVKSDKPVVDPRHLGQAAIPAVLIGLYKYGNTEQGSEDILRGNKPTSWLNLFFTDSKEKVIDSVAGYSGTSPDQAAQSMDEIADEA